MGKRLVRTGRRLAIKLADVLEVKVAELLGANSVDDENKNEIAEHLARISEQLAIKNRRSRIVWKVLAGLGILFLVINFSLVIIGVISHNSYSEDIEIQQLPISEESQIYENNP